MTLVNASRSAWDSTSQLQLNLLCHPFHTGFSAGFVLFGNVVLICGFVKFLMNFSRECLRICPASVAENDFIYS